MNRFPGSRRSVLRLRDADGARLLARHPWARVPVVVAALLAGVMASAGCRTSVEVAISADGSGSGIVTATVTLDEEALDALGGEDVFVFDDLADTAWGVPSGRATDDGGYRLVAQRAFTDAADLQEGLDELAGEGVFTNTRVKVTNGFASSSAEVSTDVSVTGEPAQFSDDALTEVLGGLPIGYTPEELLLVSGGTTPEATMDVSVDVPSGKPGQHRFDLTSGKAQSHTVSSEGSHRDTGVIVLGAAGLVVVFAGIVLVVLALVRRGRA